MLPSRYDPFSGFLPLASFRRDLDRIFGDLIREMNVGPTMPSLGMEEETMAPRFDLIEKDDEYVLKADLPGLEPDDVHVSVTENVLTVEGEKATEREEPGEGGRPRLKERQFRRYYRSIMLPESIDASQIQADLENGVLTVNLPRMAESRQRIDVKVGGQPQRIGGAAPEAKEQKAPEKKKGAA